MIHVAFDETPYGIVKRVRVVEEWLSRRREEAESSLSILDFGCGTGDQLTAPLAQAGHRVLGVDVHEESIREARRRYSLRNLEFRVATIQELASEPARFDFVICSEVLEHLPSPAGFLLGIRQLLKSGGRLVVTTPNGYGSYETLCSIERWMRRSGIHQRVRAALKLQAVGAQDSDVGFLNQDSIHIQFFKLKDLDVIFRETGFHVIERRSRTVLCGPYADLFFQVTPFRRSLINLNARIADHLPMALTADWMFLLQTS